MAYNHMKYKKPKTREEIARCSAAKLAEADFNLDTMRSMSENFCRESFDYGFTAGKNYQKFNYPYVLVALLSLTIWLLVH